MLNGVMFLWFLLTAASVIFVAIDIRKTPESKVLKWGFILLTLYTGPFGVFLYVLGCREPLPGLHERYVEVRWRQVLGSTMHCVAGDGAGILVGAVIGSFLALAMLPDVALEYVLGFGFGWTIFQALFMRGTVGGSYVLALKKTFIPELVSMNCLMAAMVPISSIAKVHVPGSESVLSPAFWFIMSIALLAGFIAAYPMNWWLVSNHLKHGMMTVGPPVSGEEKTGTGQGSGGEMSMGAGQSGMPMKSVSAFDIAKMTLLSFAIMALGIAIGYIFSR
jgi:hypothetical protein